MHLCGHGRACICHRLPPGHQGQRRRRARFAVGPGLRRREADHWSLRVCGRRAPLALQADDRLCRHHRLQVHGSRAALGRRAIAASSPASRRARPSRSSCAAKRSIKKPSGGAGAEEASTRTTSSSALKKPTCAKTPARAWRRSTPTGRFCRQRQAGLLRRCAKLELADFGLGDALRGQRHYDEAAQAYEQAAWTRGVGPELKIRSLLDAGQCHDLDRRAPARGPRLPGRHRRRPQYLPRRPGAESTCAVPTREPERMQPSRDPGSRSLEPPRAAIPYHRQGVGVVFRLGGTGHGCLLPALWDRIAHERALLFQLRRGRAHRRSPCRAGRLFGPA